MNTLSSEKVAKIHELVHQGVTVNAIALAVGCSKRTAADYKATFLAAAQSLRECDKPPVPRQAVVMRRTLYPYTVSVASFSDEGGVTRVDRLLTRDEGQKVLDFLRKIDAGRSRTAPGTAKPFSMFDGLPKNVPTHNAPWRRVDQL